jgi:hypothetical protein
MKSDDQYINVIGQGVKVIEPDWGIILFNDSWATPTHVHSKLLYPPFPNLAAAFLQQTDPKLDAGRESPDRITAIK